MAENKRSGGPASPVTGFSYVHVFKPASGRGLPVRVETAIMTPQEWAVAAGDRRNEWSGVMLPGGEILAARLPVAPAS